MHAIETVATAPAATPATRLLDRARARTLDLVAHLAPADLERVLDPLMSPLVWDLAHIAAYEDLWLCHRLGEQPLLHPELATLYDAFETPRAVRGDLPLLDAAGALRYLDDVRDRSLERTSRGVTLTPAGVRLVEHADVILAHLDAAEREARALRSQDAEISLTLATFASGVDLVVRAASELARTRASTELRVVEADPGFSLPELRSGNVDVALTYVNDGLPTEPPAWMEELPLLTEPVLAILPEDHPLADGAAIRLAQLAGERFIAEPAADHRPFTLVACHAAGFEPEIAGYSSDFALTAGLVARGGAVALIPRMALRVPGVAALLGALRRAAAPA